MKRIEENSKNLKKFYGIVLDDVLKDYILLPKYEYDSLDQQGTPGLFYIEAESEQAITYSAAIDAALNKVEEDEERLLATIPMHDFYLEFRLDEFDEVEWRFISRSEYDQLKYCKGKHVFHEFAPTKEVLDIDHIIKLVLFDELSEPIEKVESESCA